MIIDAEGTISVSGAIQDGKIDKIMIDPEQQANFAKI